MFLGGIKKRFYPLIAEFLQPGYFCTMLSLHSKFAGIIGFLTSIFLAIVVRALTVLQTSQGKKPFENCKKMPSSPLGDLKQYSTGKHKHTLKSAKW